MPEKSLIYIIGAGRSGTTLLDILLGNANNTISIGELNRFFKRDGIPPKRKENSPTALFWREIRDRFDAENPNEDYTKLAKIFRRNEYHSTAFKAFFKVNDANYKRYLNASYKAVFSKVDEEVLIESSKYPLRALNLSNHLSFSGVKIKYLYVKKDPVKVVESFKQANVEQPPKNFISANVYYFLVNVLCTIVFRALKRNHRCHKIKLETLLNEPIKTLSDIEAALDIDLGEAKRKVENNQPLDTGFLFDGNRIRLKESLLLQSNKPVERRSIGYFTTRFFNYLIYRP